MKQSKQKGERVMFVLLCIVTFLGCLILGAGSKILLKPSWSKKYEVKLTDEIGTLHTE